MRPARHVLLITLAIMAWGALPAASPDSLPRPAPFGLLDLVGESTAVPGVGNDVPGQALERIGTVRLQAGDDSSFAARSYADNRWVRLDSAKEVTRPSMGVVWVRASLLADSSLRGKDLVLSLGRNLPVEVFLDGTPIFRSAGRDVAGPQESLAPFLIPLNLRGDGRPEVLAFRLARVDWATAQVFASKTALHLSSMVHHNQRAMVRYGLFIGVNLIILVLALVIWTFERHERRWLYLALLSLVAALDNFAIVGGSDAALGLPPSLSAGLTLARIILVPWPLYLLILTLGSLYGQVGPRRQRWQAIAVVLATLALVLLAATVSVQMDGHRHNLTFNYTNEVFGLPLLFALLIIGVVMLWFIGEMIRLGFKVLRSKGYSRWVGAGALASSVLAFLLNVFASTNAVGPGFSAWLKVLGEFCAGIGVPVSVAVYLAIRTAHHGRLVARQRDELDAEVKERTSELRAEKDRADELLLNILPAEVAEELKHTGTAKARHFDQVSVLFTDFKDFTALSAHLGAEALLVELNACFQAFDEIIARHGIEKIKTIGDSYMCAAGLYAPDKNAAAALVEAALEMQEFMAGHHPRHLGRPLPAFEMRVGIHTGPVVAGIVGVKKFQYDIWGDTVNTASRMESSGEVGRVNISESTYMLVKNEAGLSFTPRGKVQAKGKGEMEMYFVS